jgi:hypothetical protein
MATGVVVGKRPIDRPDGRVDPLGQLQVEGIVGLLWRVLFHLVANFSDQSGRIDYFRLSSPCCGGKLHRDAVLPYSLGLRQGPAPGCPVGTLGLLLAPIANFRRDFLLVSHQAAILSSST